MKLFFIIFDAAIEDVVMKTIFYRGFKSYTKVPKVFGQGTKSEPHLDTHVWPGYHVAVFIKTSEEEAEVLKDVLYELSKKYRERGFHAFILPVLEEI